MLPGEGVANIRQHPGHLVRFHSQDKNISKRCHLRVGGGCFGAHLPAECSAGGFARITGDDLVSGDEPGPNKPPGQSSGHLTGAKKTNGELRGHARVLPRALAKRKPKPGSPRHSSHISLQAIAYTLENTHIRTYTDWAEFVQPTLR